MRKIRSESCGSAIHTQLILEFTKKQSCGWVIFADPWVYWANWISPRIQHFLHRRRDFVKAQIQVKSWPTGKVVFNAVIRFIRRVSIRNWIIQYHHRDRELDMSSSISQYSDETLPATILTHRHSQRVASGTSVPFPKPRHPEHYARIRLELFPKAEFLLRKQRKCAVEKNL